MCTVTKWCIFTLQNRKESQSFKSPPKSFLPRDESSHDCAFFTCPPSCLADSRRRRSDVRWIFTEYNANGQAFLKTYFLRHFHSQIKTPIDINLTLQSALKGCSFLHSGDNSHFIMHLAVFWQGPLRERRTHERFHAAGHLSLLTNWVEQRNSQHLSLSYAAFARCQGSHFSMQLLEWQKKQEKLLFAHCFLIQQEI